MTALNDGLEFFRPPPRLSPSAWAEKHIHIPVGNAMPGLIRFSNWPYQREPLDLMADIDVRRITLMWGAQTGKTQVINCGMGYFIEHDPKSQLMMQPTQGDMETWLETKLTPMLDANPVLRRRLAKPRGRKGVNNRRLKSYPGGFMMFSWSGSPNTQRQRSAPRINCDEVDGYRTTPEGEPISLLWQRAATFGDERQLTVTSTPTIKGASRVEASFNDGDRRRYFVPCPHCRHMQTLTWKNVLWQKDAAGEHLPETAVYHCEGCGEAIHDGHKLAMLRAGRWIAERPFRGHASFHLNELYSPVRRFRDIVESFLEKKALNDLQSFTNVSLAETWEEQGEKVDGDLLMKRAEAYPAAVPAGGVYLTAGIDMQQDRLEVEIVAWGVGEESWSVEARTLWGDPMHDDVWDDLDALLNETWQHESGAQLTIGAACLDTGGTKGYTQAAYEYARGKTGRRLFAIKGVGGWNRPVVSAPSRKKSGLKGRKVDLFLVGADEAKLIVHRRLGISKPGPGYCHFPEGRDADWYSQLTAERLLTRYQRGYAIREWHKDPHKRNEALDCRVYALAALKIMSPNLARLAEKFAEDPPEPGDPPARQADDTTPEDETSPPKETPRQRRKGQRRTGGWLNRFRR